MSDKASGIYVFGLVHGAKTAPFEGERDAVADATLAPPRLLHCGDLTTIVSDLTLPCDTTLDAVMQDRRQAEALVVYHHSVLRALVDADTVLPFRFGTLFHDDKAVARALKRSRGALHEAMRRVEDAVEWGVNVFVARDRLGRRIAAESLAIAELKTEMTRAGQGTAFILKRRLQRVADEESEQAIVCCLDATADHLRRTARECVRCRLQPAETHGRKSEMVLHMACLLGCGMQEDFFRLIDDLRAAFADYGFEFESTGPWPPYNFSDCRLEGDEDAA